MKSPTKLAYFLFCHPLPNPLPILYCCLKIVNSRTLPPSSSRVCDARHACKMLPPQDAMAGTSHLQANMHHKAATQRSSFCFIVSSFMAPKSGIGNAGQAFRSWVITLGTCMWIWGLLERNHPLFCSSTFWARITDTFLHWDYHERWNMLVIMDHHPILCVKQQQFKPQTANQKCDFATTQIRIHPTINPTKTGCPIHHPTNCNSQLLHFLQTSGTTTDMLQ